MSRRIAVSYATTTPESAEEGDCSDTGWIDESGHSCEPDAMDLEDGLTAVDLAVKFLKDEGAIECSSSRWHLGAWYSTESYVTDYNTGEEQVRSFHLKGFSGEEERAIYQVLFPRKGT